MFLVLLLIFPIFSAYFFWKYKDNLKEINWVVKAIWIVWLLVIFLVVWSQIFDRRESYLIVLIFWYFLVFIYFYINQIVIFYKRKEELIIEKEGFIDIIFKCFIIVLIFILYVNLLDDLYSIERKIFEPGYWYRDSWYYLFLIFSINFILFWIIYEWLDILKISFIKRVLVNINLKNDLKKELKTQLKQEILKELKESKN